MRSSVQADHDQDCGHKEMGEAMNMSLTGPDHSSAPRSTELESSIGDKSSDGMSYDTVCPGNDKCVKDAEPCHSEDIELPGAPDAQVHMNLLSNQAFALSQESIVQRKGVTR